MRTAYKCRAYPDPEQASVLNRTFGCVRVVWNRTLAWRHARYQGEQVRTDFTQANAYLTAMKATEDLGWLNEVSSVPLQQAIRHQQVAFSNFFAGRASYPRYKSRNGRQSAEYTRSGFRYRDGRLFLAKMERAAGVRLVLAGRRPGVDRPGHGDSLPGPVRALVRLLRRGRGRPEQLPATGAVVGVDLGIKDFAVTSNGEKIPNPRRLARRERNLARYQRRLARCQKGSANRAKARAKVARAHRKVRAARADFLHRTSARLVRDHDVIVIEDLDVGHGPQPVARQGDLGLRLGTFRRMVEYKAVGRAGPDSDRPLVPVLKTCSACGHLLAELRLSTRTWQCPSCGTRHDRDINAAKNILAAGLAVSACGADVRHSGPPGCDRL